MNENEQEVIAQEANEQKAEEQKAAEPGKKKLKVFCANANRTLAEDICKVLGIELGKNHVDSFADGEVEVWLGETVRGADVFVVQSTCKPVNDRLMELLVMIDALRRASAGRITAVIPYFGYARQDRKSKGRDPITAKLVANMITAAGADRIMTLDLHAPQIQGFFDIPLDHLLGRPLFESYYLEKFDEQRYDHAEFVVVSPDVGSLFRARAFAQKMHMDLAIVDKRRPKSNECVVMNVIGDVKDKTCILYDDIVDTAGSLCNAAEALLKYGAREIHACASHGVLSKDACARIENSCIKELMLLNTIPMPKAYTGKKIQQLDVAPMLAETIRRVSEEISISDMF